MPEGYLVIKLLLSEGKQTVQQIKLYFQNHKNEVDPTLVSGLAPWFSLPLNLSLIRRNKLQREKAHILDLKLV